MRRQILFTITILVILMISLSACQPQNETSGTPRQETLKTNNSLDTATVATAEPPQIAPRTPPALPVVYQPDFLNPLDVPRTYLQDTCQYLRNKWNPANSQPGTVVMLIMIQAVYKGAAEEPGGIGAGDLGVLMSELHKQGFVAIHMEQLLAFMERNKLIPPRSVMILHDNPHPAEDFDRHFRGYWLEWGWPVVNGFTSQPDTPESLWRENAELENEGWVDHQAQGVITGTYLTDDSSKTVITRELKGPLDAFGEHFGKTPIAFIWPDGGFGIRPVRAARQLGYQLGFTTNSRGPVMYNWVPLADGIDPQRPAYVPEAQIGDPLMTLPRYWPYQVLEAIDSVRIIGNQAAAYAQANKATELEYYEIVCRPTHGPIPSP